MSKRTFQYESIDESSGFILFKLNSIWKEQLEKIFDKYKVTQTQYAILASLMWYEEDSQKLSQQELANHLKIEKMTLSKSIRSLEGKNLISRIENESDSRSYLIKLLPLGRSLAKKAIAEVEDLDETFFNVLTKSDRNQFNHLCLKLVKLNQLKPD